MTDAPTGSRSVVIERDWAIPPAKIWRALTQPDLIEAWLMKNDFEPVAGHHFKFTADWGAVDGRVLTVEPQKALSYTWEAFGLESVVAWTLTPTDAGAHVRMEQSGFRPDQEQAFRGATAGWQGFLAALEKVAAQLP